MSDKNRKTPPPPPLKPSPDKSSKEGLDESKVHSMKNSTPPLPKEKK
ncbi:hypothetical protein [Marivirga lumbricoides]